jgi:hypothetical protein
MDPRIRIHAKMSWIRTTASVACLLYRFDVCFAHTGPTSQKYQEVFLSRLLSCVTSSQPEVRQAAAYGCGVLGQFGGPGYAQGSKARRPSSLHQCCGSGSGGSGMFLGHPDSLFRDSDPFFSVIRQILVEKHGFLLFFLLLYEFLSLKNDGNVPSKSNKQKNLEEN